MARNGSGTYSLYTPGNPVVTGTSISSTAFNATMNDVATALTQSVSKDGQTPITGNQAMSGYKHTGVGNATARDSYAAAGQVQDGKLNWVDSGGTADAITATYSPALTTLVDGQLCFVRAGAANATTTPTFAPNGLTAHTIVKTGGTALVAGDIKGDGHELILRYDLSNTRWELLNPSPYVPGTGTVVQVVEATPYTTYASVTTAIPADDTIPQNTEGDQIVTVSITPTSSSNRLVVEASADMITGSGSIDATLAIFQDTTANALAATIEQFSGAAVFRGQYLRYEMAAGTTSATTFKVRMGPGSGTLYINGTSAGRKLGGIAAVRLCVTEIKA